MKLSHPSVAGYKTKRVCITCKNSFIITNPRDKNCSVGCKKIHRQNWKNSLNRKYSIVYKKIVLERYGGIPVKCACCGETEYDFLCLDHVNGGGNKHRIEMLGKKNVSSREFYRRMKNLPKLVGFQVLCYNCNCAKGFTGNCPHRREK